MNCSVILITVVIVFAHTIAVPDQSGSDTNAVPKLPNRIHAGLNKDVDSSASRFNKVIKNFGGCIPVWKKKSRSKVADTSVKELSSDVEAVSAVELPSTRHEKQSVNIGDEEEIPWESQTVHERSSQHANIRVDIVPAVGLPNTNAVLSESCNPNQSGSNTRVPPKLPKRISGLKQFAHSSASRLKKSFRSLGECIPVFKKKSRSDVAAKNDPFEKLSSGVGVVPAGTLPSTIEENRSVNNGDEEEISTLSSQTVEEPVPEDGIAGVNVVPAMALTTVDENPSVNNGDEEEISTESSQTIEEPVPEDGIAGVNAVPAMALTTVDESPSVNNGDIINEEEVHCESQTVDALFPQDVFHGVDVAPALALPNAHDETQSVNNGDIFDEEKSPCESEFVDEPIPEDDIPDNTEIVGLDTPYVSTAKYLQEILSQSSFDSRCRGDVHVMDLPSVMKVIFVVLLLCFIFSL